MDAQQQNTMMAEATNNQTDEFHNLSDKWTLWAHLPHNTDWSIKSYIPIYTFNTIEETIAVTETMPSVLIENCMLFLMKEGIKPTWEDPQNRNGGCFSYKVSNKNVAKIWKELTYVTVGGTISSRDTYVNKVTGITISPKKNFCIIKIWMSDCSNQDPEVVTSDLKGLVSQGCLFKKHAPEY
jgi:translation initiation factor 4E